MNDAPSSRGFVKGVRRASFSGVSDVPGIVVEPPVHEEEEKKAPVVTLSDTDTPVPPPFVASAPPVAHTAPARRKKNIFATAMVFLFFLLLGSVAAFSFQMYWQSRETLKKFETAAPQVIIDADNKQIVERVRRHMVLPDEEPIINTVTDADKKRQEPFYVNAKDGDKVLVFSKRAILYDPVIDKIVEVGFIRAATAADGLLSPTPVAGIPEATGSAVAGVATSSGRVLLNTE